jgi:hypothetical protein
MDVDLGSSGWVIRGRRRRRNAPATLFRGGAGRCSPEFGVSGVLGFNLE